MNVSNPDKPIFRDFTKTHLVEHYQTVGRRMLEFVSDRPLTLERYPNGVEAKGFMQKNASKHFPDSIRRFEVPKQGGGTTVYPVVEREEDLAYLANQGTVTFHMWTSTTASSERPDWFVIDLDPRTGDIDGVRQATILVRALLEEVGLGGFPLATGSSGFHVWVRIEPLQPVDEVARAARALAGVAAVRHPDVMTTEFLKRDRGGRVFVDWLRNGPTATVVAPFSLRARPAAPVAVPLLWSEVPAADPGGWTLGGLDDRLELDVDMAPQPFPLDPIVEAARAAGIDVDAPFDRFGRR